MLTHMSLPGVCYRWFFADGLALNLLFLCHCKLCLVQIGLSIDFFF